MKYYEDFQIGQKFKTLGRTLTETDIVNFIALSGIYIQLFINMEYVKKETVFKQRVVPALLTLAAAVGLADRTNWHGDAIASLISLDKLVTPRPLVCDETIHVDFEIVDVRPTKNPNLGIVIERWVVKNQKDESVMQYDMTHLMHRKPGLKATS